MANNKLQKYAELFDVICDKYLGSSELGKKAAQKLFYFFERKGIVLNLRYGMHYYGPYSSKLDDLLLILESEDYIRVDTSGRTHIISHGAQNVEVESLSDEEKRNADFVIESFANKSPFQLEALATMDYVANSILTDDSSDDEIKKKFKEIKGDKFCERDIETTLSELKKLKFIA